MIFVIFYILELSTILLEVVNGTYVVGARKGDEYTKRSQMTYCPVKFCSSIQRATLAGQPMFYEIISDNQTRLENARAISISECSKLTREGKKLLEEKNLHFLIGKLLYL